MSTYTIIEIVILSYDKYSYKYKNNVIQICVIILVYLFNRLHLIKIC